METTPKTRLSLAGYAAALSVALGGVWGSGCATGTETEGDVTSAHLLALSSYDASLGSSIDVYGTNFPMPDAGRAYIVFDGLWKASNGDREQIFSEYPLKVLDSGLARWTSFGPYTVPFGDGSQIGEFEGRVSVTVKSRDGETIATDSEPQNVTFKVEPSVLVHELQPLTANCAGPIQRGIGGLAYRIRVEAVGFEPETFTYTMQTPELDRTFWSVRRLATGRFDSFGEDGQLVLPDVPADYQFYGAILIVEATSTSGESFKNAFALGVRRPIEVFYNGNVEPAQFFAPSPVSGCIPGGATSREHTWENVKEQSETRSYDINWSNDWQKTHTVEQGSSRTVGASVVNGIGFSTTDGISYNWGTQSEINGTVKFDFLVEAGIGGRRNYLRDQGVTSSSSSERTRSEGIEVSETTTETESVGESEGGSMGEGYSFVATSAESIGNSFKGQIPAGTFAVLYTQKVRYTRRGVVVTYNQCGEPSEVGELDFTDWSWAIDMGQGTSCPPLPESNLPPASCPANDCDGEL
ncbi:MAG: hypothetical protein R3A78_00650 [Polyangiales bacterium]